MNKQEVVRERQAAKERARLEVEQDRLKLEEEAARLTEKARLLEVQLYLNISFVFH